MWFWFALALASVLFILIARRCGPYGARPSGWTDDVVASVQEITFKCKDAAVSITVRHLRWDERFKAATLVARAHQSTAAYVHLFESIAPAEPLGIAYAYTIESRNALLASKSCCEILERSRIAKRIKGMRWLLERNLAMLQGNDNTFVGVDTSGKLICFAMLIDPTRDTYSMLDKIRVGLLNAPWELGWSVFYRLLSMPGALDVTELSVLKKFKPNSRYLRVERVAVEPDLQGFGIGKTLLLEVNRALDMQGRSGFLTTQNERTVALYKRYGWQTLSVDTICSRSTFPFLSWSMWREPQVGKEPHRRTNRPYTGDLDAASSTCLKESFRSDPVMQAFYTQAEWDANSEQVFSWMVWAFAAMGMTECTCSTADTSSSEVLATAVWEPAVPTLGFIWRILIFYCWYCLVIGPRKAWELGVLFVALEKRRMRHAPTAHHLQLLGTLPTHQGQGIGSQLIKTGLQRADELNLPCYLESSNPQNVPFYKRHGFAVVEEYYHFGGKRAVFTLMVRKRRSDS
jgi:GNAT superfamily N-acetyltransferase